MIDLKPREQPNGGDDPDGVRVVASESGGRRLTLLYQGLALFFSAVCIGYVLMPRHPTRAPANEDLGRPPETHQSIGPESKSRDLDGTIAAAVEAARAPDAQPPAHPLTPRRTASHRPNQAPPVDPDEQEHALKPGEEPPEEITGAEYIQRLHDAGIYEGIGAFPPPGTKPPLEGLAVPPDYQLPEGYVRHFQSTDDGQPIEPILMYSPDYEFLDENGQPIAIPEDRVVPPDQAPPGFPVRKIEIPEKRKPGDTSR